ncbi:2-phosphosulfolactate phosphatase [Herbihabitans rhizosphaerae]|uniref:Probable 2-phosphosulfolactate phosphatase n=1 Tax=Herbihabitans rhizosphaerae TaxID=1872711 RepID=A0A4Q7KD95_9PSEU|nr:2-phosphosulfolactate phosphatase [Herbihabitans rhizosphaerae]RZS31335.1 2-phosphosulfolactate phosphatase [Herbihabitans rhizosphaerae]
MSAVTVYQQEGYRVRLEWGPDGVRELASCCDVVIVVDVLVFTTSVDIALGRGARVMPLPWRDERADEAARAAGAVLTRSGLVRKESGFSSDAAVRGPSLRPSSLVDLEPGTLLAMASPNGATLCAAAAEAGTTVIAGCLRNASAVARAAAELAGDGVIGVVPAGERWHHHEQRTLRPSIEEYLGAGAITSALSDGLSPEAELAALAYRAAGDRVPELIANSVSGRELAAAGVSADVPLASDVDSSKIVPLLVDGVFVDRV